MLRDIHPRRLREASREPDETGREGEDARLDIRPIMREAAMHPSPTVPMTRRRLLGTALAAATSAAIGRTRRTRAQASGLFALPPLPYPEEALAPVISGRTIGFHYGKHHRAYVDNLNKAVAGTDLAHRSLDDIVKATAGDPARVAIFHNAAQDWNHTFYWNSMRPNGGGTPTGIIADHIKDSFGDYAKFRQEFVTAAVTQFGSGWAWLVQDQDKKLKVVKTANADTPMARGLTCLLTCDVWEHAYYLDYQNRRPDYVNAWLDKLANWDFAAHQLAA
jgi:Fe-Mn family superoxide dismutase